MKILIIEDEKLLADSLRTLLEQKGFVLDEDSIGDERSIFSPFAVYSKGYIAVLIYRDSYTDSDTITHIGLSAFDPQYSGVIYN